VGNVYDNLQFSEGYFIIDIYLLLYIIVFV